MTHPSTHLFLCTAPALGAGGAGLVIQNPSWAGRPSDGLTQLYAEASPPRCAGSSLARTATSIDCDRALARLRKKRP